jgi:two-component system response regulator RstA
MQKDAIITALLVEDDVRLASLTRDYLNKHDVLVTVLHNGNDGLKEALTGSYDVLLLDLMLPGMDGIRVCQRVREQSDIPIIMLTARGEEADRVLGLEIGADDYMPKPFSPRELLARIRAVIRRAWSKAGPRSERVQVRDLVLDPGSRTARLGEEQISLTSYEFDVLLALAERAGRVLSREQLMELARGSADEAFDRSIDVHVSRLRQKLGDDPKNPRWIRTVRGVGYQLLTEH